MFRTVSIRITTMASVTVHSYKTEKLGKLKYWEKEEKEEDGGQKEEEEEEKEEEKGGGGGGGGKRKSHLKRERESALK